MSKKQVRHIVGDGIDETGVQRCLICGEIICDYRNAMFAPGSPIPNGWAAGELYVYGKNPTSFSTDPFDNVEIVNCQ